MFFFNLTNGWLPTNDRQKASVSASHWKTDVEFSFWGPGLRAYAVAFDKLSSQTSSCADQFEGHLAPNQTPRKWRLFGRTSLRPWNFGFEARSSEKVTWGRKTENTVKSNAMWRFQFTTSTKKHLRHSLSIQEWGKCNLLVAKKFPSGKLHYTSLFSALHFFRYALHFFR